MLVGVFPGKDLSFYFASVVSDDHIIEGPSQKSGTLHSWKLSTFAFLRGVVEFWRVMYKQNGLSY